MYLLYFRTTRAQQKCCSQGHISVSSYEGYQDPKTSMERAHQPIPAVVSLIQPIIEQLSTNI